MLSHWWFRRPRFPTAESPSQGPWNNDGRAVAAMTSVAAAESPAQTGGQGKDKNTAKERHSRDLETSYRGFAGG